MSSASHFTPLERKAHPRLAQLTGSTLAPALLDNLDWHHAARPLRVEDQAASIDLGIYPLIQATWSLGIRTINSCENSGLSGRVWLGFASPNDMTRFVDLASGAPDSPIWQDIRYSSLWKYSILLAQGPAGEAWIATLQFPVEHIKGVTENLISALGAREPQD